MSGNIFSKRIINNIYKRLNTSSKVRCKGRYPDDPSEFQLCFNQAMADNADKLIDRLRRQLANCNRTRHPENCSSSIEKLVKYLESQKQDSENKIDQLKDLEG